MIRLNLLPIKEEQKRIQQIRELVFITAIIAGVLVGNFMFYQYHQEMVDTQQKIVSDLRKVVQTAEKEVKKKLDKETKRNKEYLERIDAINSLEKLRKGLLKMLDEVNKQIPHKTWISELVKKGNLLTLNGGAGSFEEVSTFAHALKGETRYFKKVEIKDARQETKEEKGQGKVNYISFEIVCDLK